MDKELLIRLEKLVDKEIQEKLILKRVASGEPLTAEEQRLVDRHPHLREEIELTQLLYRAKPQAWEQPSRHDMVGKVFRATSSNRGAQGSGRTGGMRGLRYVAALLMVAGTVAALIMGGPYVMSRYNAIIDPTYSNDTDTLLADEFLISYHMAPVSKTSGSGNRTKAATSGEPRPNTADERDNQALTDEEEEKLMRILTGQEQSPDGPDVCDPGDRPDDGNDYVMVGSNEEVDFAVELETAYGQMLGLCSQWKSEARKQGVDWVNWDSLQLSKEYSLGDSGQERLTSVRIKLEFTGATPEQKKAVLDELQALFADVPLVNSCVVDEDTGDEFPLD